MNNNPLLGRANFYCQGKNMEELRNCVLHTSLELESTKLAAQKELKKRDDQLNHLQHLLATALGQRDQAIEKCHRLSLENLLLLQTTPLSGTSSIEDEPIIAIESSNASDCAESIVSSPTAGKLVPVKALPEKGKLLQAVMEAGPLLHTLLIAGPLPQWQHPPPPLESFHIPPVTIPSQQSSNDCGRKRILSQGSHSVATQTKFQKGVLQ